MVVGAALSPFITPMGAAALVGGIETARTGDIGKGLLAGLGAYGGAGLTSGLSNAGAATVAPEAGAQAVGSTAAEMGTTEGMTQALSANTGVGSSAGINSFDALNPGQVPLDPSKVSAYGQAYSQAAQPSLANIQTGFGQLGTEAGRSAVYDALPKYTLPAAGAALVNAATPEPEVPGMPGEEDYGPYKLKRLSANFQGSTPVQPNPYYRPTGLGYAEGGGVKKEEENLASAVSTATNTQAAAPGTTGAPDWASALLRISQMPGNSFAGRIANAVVNPQQAASAVQQEYQIDPRTGQAYIPRGLGYPGYAAGGGVMMAAGGSYEDEPLGDDGMAAGGIAAYAPGGAIRDLPESVGIPRTGIFRDTDSDTARKDALEAAMIRNKKLAKASNIKLANMPKTSVKGLGDVEEMAGGGLGGYSDGGRMLKGPGDGMSDSIPATIGRKQPARLADGEFVVPADVVSHLGNGSTDAGAKKLYSMMDKIRKARTGKKKQAPAVKADRYLPA
jgi:hypothetical protein